jgi:hypothetical protein
MGEKTFCQACGETGESLLLRAMINLLGAKVYPKPTYCPKTKNHKHIMIVEEEKNYLTIT